MREIRLENEISLCEFEAAKINYAKWAPIFLRLGLKPHRFIYKPEAVFVCTNEGWYRLSLVMYEKQELRWVRNILEYLEERSFSNWAMPWQKTIIWEENSHCYLIQPWLFTNNCFNANDPASVARLAEILADFYRSGKDYHEIKGIEISRDRWSTIETLWELELEKIDHLSGEFGHEKLNKEFNELKKGTVKILVEVLSNWKSSGVNALYEHHRQAGVLGHGNLSKENIIWCGNDYYLLNWEHLAFQPKIADLAALISNIGFWEPEWIIFLITEYSKLQPFWSEEYGALMALLRYPAKGVLLLTGVEAEELQRKAIKEEVKEMAKRERCLAKVWKELGSKNRWIWGTTGYPANEENGKISLALTPVESWGDYSGSVDSLIRIDNEQKLPQAVIERLTLNNQNGVVGGKEDNILEGAAQTGFNYTEILEQQPPPIIEEIAKETEEVAIKIVSEEGGSNIEPPIAPPSEDKPVLTEEKSALIKWSGFPKSKVLRK
ncbi:MAG: hypothetical protein GXY86_15655 [Firmicutes bacterium]|nr:hypothetical protein [Bacillota bacterium]